MKQIPVVPLKITRRTVFALVDDEDYDFLNKFEWYPRSNGKKLYARARIDGKYADMHQLILPSPSYKLTPDHINNNGLDNQKHNLRLATKSQQGANTAAKGKNKYKGVHFKKQCNKYIAEIMCKGVRQYLGSFRSEAEAALAYNKAAFEAFGEFAKLNEVADGT
jgi:hypothetical protein